MNNMINKYFEKHGQYYINSWGFILNILCFIHQKISDKCSKYVRRNHFLKIKHTKSQAFKFKVLSKIEFKLRSVIQKMKNSRKQLTKTY